MSSFSEHHISPDLESQTDSMRSSTILIEGKNMNGAKNDQKKSLCEYQIISEDCDQNRRDEELYDEESSLPLCMKEYLINENQSKSNTLSEKQLKPVIIKQKKFTSQQKIQKKQTTSVLLQHDKTHSHNRQTNTKQSQPQPKDHTNHYSQLQSHHFSQTIEQRNMILSIELQNQKIKNLHFQKMLSILIEQDNIQKQRLEQILADYEQKELHYQNVEKENSRLKMVNQELSNQVEHLKQLIYIANSNYEALEQKLMETEQKLTILQLQKQKREIDFHQKLDNLKLVLKSLMTNLKSEQFSNGTKRTQDNIAMPDGYAGDNCFSFGDKDYETIRENDCGTLRGYETLKERKDVTSKRTHHSNNKTESLNAFNKTVSQKTTQTKQNPKQFGFKKTQQGKENLFLTQKMDDTFQSQNFSSTKTTTINKLKSPKNIAVEQNYRKLFMKTLVSSSQKGKN